MGRTVLIEVSIEELGEEQATRIEALSKANLLSAFTQNLLDLYLAGDLVLKDTDEESEVKPDEDILKVLGELKETLISGQQNVEKQNIKVIDMLSKGVVAQSVQEMGTAREDTMVPKPNIKPPEIKTKIIVGGGKGPKGKMANLSKLKKLKGEG